LSNPDRKNTDNDDLDDDGLDEERLIKEEHNREYMAAQEANPDIFTSFSEGMAIAKFELLEDPAISAADQSQVGASTSSPSNSSATAGGSTLSAPHLTADEFQSFSDGLPGVEKFEIVSSEEVIALSDYFKSVSCPVTEYLTADMINGFVPEFLPPQEKGRSHALDILLARICDVPWYKDIKVRFTSGDLPTEYCFDTDTMVLNPTLSKTRQMVDFAHQAYHATNKHLHYLYKNEKNEMLDQNSFVDVWLWAEVAANITEVNVVKELAGGADCAVIVFCQEDDGSLTGVNVDMLIKERGLKCLKDSLNYSMVRGSQQLRLVTVLHDLHRQYAETYAQAQPAMLKLIEHCLHNNMLQEHI
jgi:hypothetical protein